MKFATGLVSILALATSAFALPVETETTQDVTFGLVTIHSGSPIQYATVYLDDTRALTLGPAGTPFVGHYNKADGTIKTDAGNYLQPAPEGSGHALTTWNRPAPGWTITDSGDLAYNGAQAALACPRQNGVYDLYWAADGYSCTNGIGVVLHTA
ncbi:uncharacterized protein V1510DRAFT_366635 [Dipodascopsis tothii]|uniref:uncharacterized protein n=1 Tax=Dipodascopsis tothii TaxID=44089 RepID=UPI0034CF9F0B